MVDSGAQGFVYLVEGMAKAVAGTVDMTSPNILSYTGVDHGEDVDSKVVLLKLPPS